MRSLWLKDTKFEGVREFVTFLRDSTVLNCNLHCNFLEAWRQKFVKVVDLGRPDHLIKVVLLLNMLREKVMKA